MGKINKKNFNNNKSSSKKISSPKKKNLEDYAFYIGTKQASDFEVTLEYVLNHIKKTYEYGNDISESLRKLAKADIGKWEPTLKASTKTDPEAKKTEERQFELKYKAELDKAMRRMEKYEYNLFKAYAELWERCSKSMKSKIEARTDYDSDTCNNPIKLLEAIKEHSLNYEETRYDMRIIANAFEAHFTCKQKNLNHYKITQKDLRWQEMSCTHIWVV